MSNAQAASYPMLTDVTTTVASDPFELGSDNKTFHIVGQTTSGSGAATVVIEVSNNTAWPWLPAATINLTLSSTPVADGAVIFAGWKFVRARVSAISGTEARVSASLGV
jgi:predicted P-loop ATPase/GTPase